MTFGILVTLWASSSGLEALRHALNLAYDVADPPSFWRTRLREPAAHRPRGDRASSS